MRHHCRLEAAPTERTPAGAPAPEELDTILRPTTPADFMGGPIQGPGGVGGRGRRQIAGELVSGQRELLILLKAKEFVLLARKRLEFGRCWHRSG